jgi:hypothetical protein
MQELFELGLGRMTMEEYEKKYYVLLKYVGFIKDEKVEVQSFLSGFPYFYKDKIEIMKPKI